MGNWYDHWCSSGVWQQSPLVCRRGCGNSVAPTYAATCARTVSAETFDGPADSLFMRMLSWPPLPWGQFGSVWSQQRVPNQVVAVNVTSIVMRNVSSTFNITIFRNVTVRALR